METIDNNLTIDAISDSLYSSENSSNNAALLWQKIIGRADIKRCTHSKLVELMLLLFKANIISAKELLFISYDLQDINNKISQETGFTFSPYYTKTNDKGELNWLEEYHHKLTLARELGIQENISIIKKFIAIFEKLS